MLRIFRLVSLFYSSFIFKFAHVDAAEHTKLKVRVELEAERRMRIQSALDSAEKRCFASNRLLEKKVRSAVVQKSSGRLKMKPNATAVRGAGRQRGGVVGGARKLAVTPKED